MRDSDSRLLQEAYSQILNPTPVLNEGFGDIAKRISSSLSIPFAIAVAGLGQYGCNEQQCDPDSKDKTEAVLNNVQKEIPNLQKEIEGEIIKPNQIYKINWDTGKAEEVKDETPETLDLGELKPNVVYFIDDKGTVYEVLDPGEWKPVKSKGPSNMIPRRASLNTPGGKVNELPQGLQDAVPEDAVPEGPVPAWKQEF